MVDVRRTMGNAAEDQAAAFLIGKRMTILARQYRKRLGEIDIVALDRGEVVFVEVKARKTREFGYPEEAVTARKLAKIAAVGEIFLREQNLLRSSYRIDVIAIDQSIDPVEIHHVIGVG